MRVPFFSRLRRRERVLIWLAFFFLALYLLVTFAALPMLTRHRLNGRLIEEKRLILSGYLETLEKEKVLQRGIQGVAAAAGGFDRYLLKSDKPAVAAAELQNRVKEAAAAHGLSITSEKIVKPTQSDNFVNIPVEITASGGVGPLKDFLYDIETGVPLLTIPEITIRSTKKRSFDAVQKKYVDIDELQATVLISGQMKGEL